MSAGTTSDVTDPAPTAAVAGATPSLTIRIRLGLGRGPTRLAAFDHALREAGVADRNLLVLSSVIPPGAVVDSSGAAADCPGEWGDRLYVVMANERVETHNEEAWAGVAWRQDLDTGQGLFVEHEGHARKQVESDLRSTLESISAARSGRRWGPIEMAVTGITCTDEPVCALAVAIYEHEPWRGNVIDLRDD